MSDPRAIPDEERPFIPEERIPPKETTDFDADSTDADSTDAGSTDPDDVESGPEPADGDE